MSLEYVPGTGFEFKYRGQTGVSFNNISIWPSEQEGGLTVHIKKYKIVKTRSKNHTRRIKKYTKKSNRYAKSNKYRK